jgi:predicted MFS family arabinose efflux permease
MFVVGTDLYVVSPLLPLIASDYHVSAALTGLAVTVFSITYMASAPVLGHFSDRIGRLRMLSYCLGAFAAANVLTALCTGFGWLLATRLLAGAAAAGVSPSIYALVGEAAPADRRASWLALTVSGLLASLALGAPIGAVAGASFGWAAVFAVLGSSSLALVWANRRIWSHDRGRGLLPGSSVSALPATIFGRRLAPMVVWSTALYGMYTYLGAGLSASGFTAHETARVIFVYGCGAVAGVLIGGRAADRLGTRFVSGASLCALGTTFLVLRIALHTGMLVEFAAGTVAVVAQLFFPAQQAGLAADFPARRATVLAWNNSALFLGIALGSLLGGQAMALAGFATDLVLSAGVAMAAWLINAAVVPVRPVSGAAGKPAEGATS